MTMRGSKQVSKVIRSVAGTKRLNIDARGFQGLLKFICSMTVWYFTKVFFNIYPGVQLCILIVNFCVFHVFTQNEYSKQVAYSAKFTGQHWGNRKVTSISLQVFSFSFVAIFTFYHFATWTTGFRSYWNKFPWRHIPEPGLAHQCARSILFMNKTTVFRNSLNTTCQSNPTLGLAAP